MAALITAIQNYAGWLYALLGLLMAREIVAIWRSGHERDLALFGLEREAATGRAIRAVVTLFLLGIIGVGIYTVAHVVAPALPPRLVREVAERGPILETPPTVVLPTDTPTPPPPTPTRSQRIVTAAPSPSAASVPTQVAPLCLDPDVAIVSPAQGAVLTTATPVVVTVRFSPESRLTYRLELGAGPVPETWAPLGDPRSEPVDAGVVATLPADRLNAGVYTLRLVLDDADGEVDSRTCAVSVRVP